MKTVPREDIRRAAGRALIIGFEGQALSAELKELLREVQPAGLIFFDRNFESPLHLAELTRELKLYRTNEPLLLCVDQEGGRVARIKEPATRWPSMRQLGRLNDPSLARQVGVALGRELRAVNVDIDLAPVLDVDTNAKNPVIGNRSFSSDPKVVAALGAALVQGLVEGGVGACGKHFPGHGDTDLDSHLALPHVGHDPERLRDIEWPPFAAAIHAGLDAIMTAHVVVECLDASSPATLSPSALRPLRAELGFAGVIISDDVEMKALADHFSPDQIAARALSAGVDVFLSCRRPEVVLGLYRAIVQGVEQQAIAQERLLDAAGRVERWRAHYYRDPGARSRFHEVVGCPDHQMLAAQIAAAAEAAPSP